MKFVRTKTTGTVFAGIFQSSETGRVVLRNLRRGGFRRSAALYASAAGKVRVDETGASALALVATATALGLAVGVALCWRGWWPFDPDEMIETVLGFLGCALLGAVIGWIVSHLFTSRIDQANLARFRKTILPNETMVVVEFAAEEASRVIATLRDVGDDDPPVTFTFHPPAQFAFQPTAQLLRKEAPSGQRLAEKAVALGHSLASVRGGRQPRALSLLVRLHESERILQHTDASLSISAEAEKSAALSTEWLLDNAYLIQEQINDVRQDLPPHYYEELPVVASGPQAGLPRVYRIASEMVAESDASLDVETIRNFLVAFQTVSTLNIGELWAVPPDAAPAPDRMFALARNRSRAGAARKRAGGFLGKPPDRGGAAQPRAASQNDGGIGRTASATGRAFRERTGGQSLRRGSGAADRDALARALLCARQCSKW